MTTRRVQELLASCFWLLLLQIESVDALNASDCFNNVYKSKVATNTADDGTIDLVAACAADGSMPFTLCQQKLWLTAEIELYKTIHPGSRLFIGFSDSLETADYFFMADGGFVFNQTLNYFVDTPGSEDTRKSCVAIQFPVEKTWRTPKCMDPNLPHFFGCEAAVCNSSWKSALLSPGKKLCYKTNASDSMRTLDQAKSDCHLISGNLLQLSTFENSNDIVTLMATTIVDSVAGQRGITMWMEDSSCRSWGNGLYMERVTCDLKRGDKYMCMNVNPSSNYAGSYKGCRAVPSDNKGLVASTETMQVRYCISLCQGQGRSYAGLRNQDCFCVETTTATSELCSTSCPGNPGQPCGGPNAMSIFDSKSYFGAAADSCMTFYEMGFYPPAGQQVTFKTISPGTINCSLETLIPPNGSLGKFRPCPTGWVMFNQSCLYFGHTQSTSDEAHKICQTMRGDLAYLDNATLQFVRMTVKRPRPFSRHDAWHFGAYSLINQSWTWRNGSPMRTIASLMGTNNSSVTSGTKTVLSYTLRYNYMMQESSSVVDVGKQSAFICSLNEQFLGQRSPIQDVGMLAQHQSSVNMSVTACIQLCLDSSRRQIAQVFGDTCICSLDVIAPSSSSPTDFVCQTPSMCPGHNGQICGCDGKASFYFVDPALTPRYYSCSELQANGVGVNGVYTIVDPSENAHSERETLCIFLNRSETCPDALPYSYRNKCYSAKGERAMHYKAANYCMKQGYNLAVPNDDDEQRFLVHLMFAINGPKSQSWLGTVNYKGNIYNITVGDNAFSHQDTDEDSEEDSDEDRDEDRDEYDYKCLYLTNAARKAFGNCRKKRAPICQSGEYD